MLLSLLAVAVLCLIVACDYIVGYMFVFRHIHVVTGVGPCVRMSSYINISGNGTVKIHQTPIT